VNLASPEGPTCASALAGSPGDRYKPRESGGARTNQLTIKHFRPHHALSHSPHFFRRPSLRGRPSARRQDGKRVGGVGTVYVYPPFILEGELVAKVGFSAIGGVCHPAIIFYFLLVC